MKTATIAAILATGLLLSGCGGGTDVSQTVADHYSAMSDGERSALCDLWNSGSDAQDNIVEIEMALAPDWDGGQALTDVDEQELGNAIAGWYESNC